MMHTFMLMVTALLMVGHSAGSKTRIGEEMLIDQAFKQADVVVIAFANAHRDAKPGEMKPPQDVEKYLAGVITTFEIMQVVKGNEPRKTIELVHFKFAINGQRLAHSPPSLVRFKIRPKPKEKEGELTITIVGNSGPEFYMLFLKKRADGKYEPVSGQIDPVDSVKMMSNYRE